MISTLSFFPPLGALFAQSANAFAEAATPPAAAPEPHTAPPTTPRSFGHAARQASNGQLDTNIVKVITTPNSPRRDGMNIDEIAGLTQTPSNLEKSHIIKAVDIVNSPDVHINSPGHGLSSSGLTSVWLENRGSITAQSGTGVALKGEKADEVINHGLIAGGNGVALDMGGGDDLLVVKNGSRFKGEVDGGSGTNQVVLEDTKGGTFEGATRMQHLWVGKGAWELTGALHDNRHGKVYGDAALTNRSVIKGTLDIDAGGSYSGGTVDSLNVGGTLLLDPENTPRTRIRKDLHLKPGSTMAFKVGADQAHSTLKVGNTLTLDNATLKLDVQPESEALLTRQLRIADAASIKGTFSAVTSNLTTLEPELLYKPEGIFVGFKRKQSAAPSVDH